MFSSYVSGEPTPKMQVAFSTVFGPLKDHPSQATPRAEGDDMLGVIEMRHDPAEGGNVMLDGQLLSQWLPWHFDHCYNDQLNRAGVLRAVLDAVAVGVGVQRIIGGLDLVAVLEAVLVRVGLARIGGCADLKSETILARRRPARSKW